MNDQPDPTVDPSSYQSGLVHKAFRQEQVNKSLDDALSLHSTRANFYEALAEWHSKKAWNVARLQAFLKDPKGAGSLIYDKQGDLTGVGPSDLLDPGPMPVLEEEPKSEESS